MAQLQTFREGWASERLAELALAQLSFVTKPVTVADDTGVDFACTLFEVVRGTHQPALFPKIGFAVQVKSSSRTVSLTRHRALLDRLELPFYVAVANRKRLSIDLFSGRHLPFALALKGPSVPTLTAKLVPGRKVLFKDSVEGGPKSARVLMPLLLTLAANASAKARREATRVLAADCLEASLNIAHKRVGQFVFTALGGHDRAVLAGPGSARVFRNNFSDRLTEYCRNLAFIAKNRSRRPSRTEVEAILTTVRELRAVLPQSALRERAAKELSALFALDAYPAVATAQALSASAAARHVPALASRRPPQGLAAEAQDVRRRRDT